MTTISRASSLMTGATSLESERAAADDRHDGRRAMAAIERDNPSLKAVGFEAKLWQAAVALRNNMDAAVYKHVVLGLIFLKYISDAFEAKHAEL